MDFKHFEQKLLAKQRECQAEIAALEGEARHPTGDEVRDPTDDAAADQAASQGLAEGATISGTLQKVEDALQRIRDGAYGKCVLCGRQIEPARLEAVPWAQYCLKDQEKTDQEKQDKLGQQAYQARRSD